MGFLELEPNEEFCGQLTSTTEILDESKFTVFPNPVAETLTVEWDGMMRANVELINLVGQSVFSEADVSGGRIYIDVAGLESGIYLLSIDGEYARKVVVESGGCFVYTLSLISVSLLTNHKPHCIEIVAP